MVNTLIPFKRLDNMLDSMLNSSLTIHPNWWNGQEVSSVPRADILEGDKDYQIRLDRRVFCHVALLSHSLRECEDSIIRF